MTDPRKFEITNGGRACGNRKLPRVRLLTAGATIAAVLLVAPALATPPTDFTPQGVSLATFPSLKVHSNPPGSWEVNLDAAKPTDLAVDHLLIASRGSSGWHTHAGVTVETVNVGEVVNFDTIACTTTTYKVGQSYIIPANQPHKVENMTNNPAEFTAVQIRPAKSPPVIDAPQPTNCIF